MGVRKVRNHGGNIIGEFPSLKMGRMISYESLIELDYIYVLEYECQIITFAEQPLTISYIREGKKKPYSYTPDFLLNESSQPILVECKPQALIDTEENSRKFTAARTWCNEKGWTFLIVTDEQLRSGVRLANIKKLTRFARRAIDPVLRGQVYALLGSTSDRLCIGDLARSLSPEQPQLAFSLLYTLAYHHIIEMAIDNEILSDQTLVSLPKPV